VAINRRKFVLRIHNRHVKASGPPPSLVSSRFNCIGYYENEYGEQCVAVGDRRTGKVQLWGGDWEWHRVARVLRYGGDYVPVLPGGDLLILRPLEFEWLSVFMRTNDLRPGRWKPSPESASQFRAMRWIRYYRANPAWSKLPAIKVFVSSPTDLRRERLLVIDVCKYLTKTLRVPLLPVLWEGGGPRHPDVPSITPLLSGHGPQAVISQHLWEVMGGYDIYVGMLGRSHGTPTGRFSSGTLAELDQALRWRHSTARPSNVFFYLKESANARSKSRALDHLRSKGLVGRFQSRVDLERQLKAHLTEAVTSIIGVNPFWHRIAKDASNRVAALLDLGYGAPAVT
jgi:hypothetical protein